jgi:hypothetical protein
MELGRPANLDQHKAAIRNPAGEFSSFPREFFSLWPPPGSAFDEAEAGSSTASEKVRSADLAQD